MDFNDILENPTQTALITWLIGILLAEGLGAIESSVLGRLIIDIGEALVTRGVILAAREAIEASQAKVAEENFIDSTGSDTLLNTINELYSKNQYLRNKSGNYK